MRFLDIFLPVLSVDLGRRFLVLGRAALSPHFPKQFEMLEYVEYKYFRPLEHLETAFSPLQ